MKRAASIGGTTVLLFMVAALACGMGGQEREESSRGSAAGRDGESTLQVFVSIQPQRYFVERIAGDAAAVSVLVPPDRGPATYEPTPRQVEALSGADLYLRIGVPFENAFIPRIESALPRLKIVDTSSGIQRRSLEAHSHEDEEHADEELQNPDPHIWMSPPLVKRQAQTIRDALVEIRPEDTEQFQENYEEFAAEIDRLHEELSALLEPIRGETIFVFHPAFGYFADAYGLEQEAIETGGDQPTAARLAQLIAEARAEGVRVVFVQPQFAQGPAERVAEAIDGAVVSINPLTSDWLENMRAIARSVRDGLSR